MTGIRARWAVKGALDMLLRGREGCA